MTFASACYYRASVTYLNHQKSSLNLRCAAPTQPFQHSLLSLIDGSNSGIMFCPLFLSLNCTNRQGCSSLSSNILQSQIFFAIDGNCCRTCVVSRLRTPSRVGWSLTLRWRRHSSGYRRGRLSTCRCCCPRPLQVLLVELPPAREATGH